MPGYIDRLSVRYNVELMDLPVELLEEILMRAAVASLTACCEDEAVEAVMTTLGDVCRLWRAIVSDRLFRRKFWNKLIQAGLWRLRDN